MKSRALAAKVLVCILQDKFNLQDAILKRLSPGMSDLPFIKAICFSVCRHYFQLSFIATSLLSKPLKQKDQDVFCLILIGLEECIRGERPDYASVSESVNATKDLKKPWARGLVNACLRSFLRQKDAIIEAVSQQDEVRYAHPQWFIDRIKTDWPVDWQSMLQQNMQHPPQTLRVDVSQVSRQAYLQTLEDASISARPHPLVISAVIIDKPIPTNDIPGFAGGVVSIQDAAAQAVCDLMDCQDGQRVLDACAAPGGKTCHLLQNNKALASLLALDKSAVRLGRLQENVDRLGLSGLDTLQIDACEVDKWWDNNPFDRILLDAPCSATGVIRRHPEIKLLREEPHIQALNKQQAALLDALWPTLKQGGSLVYVTCSVLYEENESILRQFGEKHDDAVFMPVDLSFGVPLDFGRQSLPGESDMDGFYFAKIDKKA